MRLIEFLESHIPENKIQDMITYGLLTSEELDGYQAAYLAKECVYPRNEFPFLPVVVDIDSSYESDRDHGAWTERVIFKHNDKLVAFNLEFFGQGDVDYDFDPEMYEVVAQVITKTIYNKK